MIASVLEIWYSVAWMVTALVEAFDYDAWMELNRALLSWLADDSSHRAVPSSDCPGQDTWADYSYCKVACLVDAWVVCFPSVVDIRY